MRRVELRVPRLSEMFHRQRWLSDPDTMAYNRNRDLGGAEGYHPDTGCIDFPRQDWRYWRQVWILNEPDFYTAYICDADTGDVVGEVCWFREEALHTAGVLIEARHRGRGYCAPALRALADHAFGREDVGVLRCALPEDNLPALRGYARAGFHAFGRAEGTVEMKLTREDWERMVRV